MVNNWRRTSKYRINQFQNEDTLLNSLLLEWPLYKNPDGDQLIDIDFDTMHPGKQFNLLNDFEDFISKIMVCFDEEIKDKKSLEMLQILKKGDLQKSKKHNYCFYFTITPTKILVLLLFDRFKRLYCSIAVTCDSSAAKNQSEL